MIMKVEKPEIKTTEPINVDRTTVAADLQNQAEKRQTALDAQTSEPTAEQLANAKEELQKNLKTRKKSWGEKAYDWLVYQGIGFGANEVGSMAVTGFFERSKNRLFGEPRLRALSEWLAPKFNARDLKAGAFTAKETLMTASLNLVGCFVVPAIKIVDGYKAGIVKWLNHRFANQGLTPEQIDARDKEVAAAIASEPTQTWKTLTIGRLISMCVTIPNGGLLCGRKLKDGLSFNNRLQRGFDEVASAVGRNVGLKKYTDGGKNYYTSLPFPAATEVNAFHYYAGLAGPETMGCLISSTVLEGVSKYAAKRDPRVRNAALRDEAIKNIAKKKMIEPRELSYAQQVSSEEAVVGPRTL
jgi:hypothetical protein